MLNRRGHLPLNIEHSAFNIWPVSTEYPIPPGPSGLLSALRLTAHSVASILAAFFSEG